MEPICEIYLHATLQHHLQSRGTYQPLKATTDKQRKGNIQVQEKC